MIVVKSIKEAEIMKNVHQVDARKLYDTENAQAVHLSLNPGETLKKHITPVDVFFFVIEGQPDILIGDESQKVEANTLVESPKDIVHCISNNTNNMVRVLVVKTPRPTSATKVL